MQSARASLQFTLLLGQCPFSVPWSYNLKQIWIFITTVSFSSAHLSWLLCHESSFLFILFIWLGIAFFVNFIHAFVLSSQCLIRYALVYVFLLTKTFIVFIVSSSWLTFSSMLYCLILIRIWYLISFIISLPLYLFKPILHITLATFNTLSFSAHKPLSIFWTNLFLYSILLQIEFISVVFSWCEYFWWFVWFSWIFYFKPISFFQVH